MLKTRNNFTEFGEITNWGGTGSLARYIIESEGHVSQSDFSLEDLAEGSMEVGDIVVTGFVDLDEDGEGVTFAIAQADLEKPDSDFENNIDGDIGVDTVDLENVIDNAGTDEEVASWIREHCTHFVIAHF